MEQKEWGDLHCHITMKPFHSATKNEMRLSMGNEFEVSQTCGELSRITSKMLPATDKKSQASLNLCKEGDLAVVFNSLYPIEVPWFDLSFPVPLLINQTNAFCCMSDFSKSAMNEWFIKIIKNKKDAPLPYFDRLTDEYSYLCSVQAHASQYDFVLINSFEDYLINKQIPFEERPIAIVNSIEGAHSLFNISSFEYISKVTFEEVNTLNYGYYKYLISQASQHIAQIKAWKYPPVFITLAHHFWNFLIGHAQSIGSWVLNQKEGLDAGFSTLGYEVVRLLLSTQNGPRILIDIKHLSPQSRIDFYALLDKEFGQIPLLASHAAVSGLRNISDTCLTVSKQVFQTGEINLYDTDLKRIVDSNGIIGIMMEEGRLLNADLMKIIMEEYNDMPDGELKMHYLRRRMSEIILAHALYIVEKTGVAGWDCICIGSDFDGMINSLDSFKDVKHISPLFDTILQILQNNDPILKGISTFSAGGQTFDCLYNSEQVAQLKHNLTPETIVDKLRLGNLERFMKLVLR